MIDDPPERWFSFFGLVVMRKTDLLAAAAFVISLSTAVYQFVGFMRGAQLEIYHPDTVYIYFDLYANGVIATRFGGQMTATNSGDTGQNGVLRELALEIQAGPKKFNEQWFSFATVSRKGTELSVEPKETAHSLVVNGGSAVSQMVTFSPRVRDCNPGNANVPTNCNDNSDYISDTEFLNALVPGKTMRLTFLGTIAGKNKTLQTSCSVFITQDLITILAANDWYAARCFGSS
jgi:hypothetical protein